MKYHNLPTVKQIDAYNSGRMSSGERKWMDSMIKRNKFVKESVEAAKTADMAAVGRISSHISSTVTSQYLVRAGFWSKYGGWISLSSVAVIVGLVAYFGPDYYEQYTNENNDIAELNEVESGNEDVSFSSSSDENSLTNSSNNTPEPSPSTEKSIAASETNHELDVAEESTAVNTEEEKLLSEAKSETENSTVKKIEKTEEVQIVKTTETKPKENKRTVLAVKKVFISSKFNLDDKTETNFPKYPGGDQALCDYFKGKIRSIEVLDAEKYSNKATITLQVSAKGKVTDSSISGQIHPTHEAALKTAIQNLPRFDSGKSKVQYSVVVSF